MQFELRESGFATTEEDHALLIVAPPEVARVLPNLAAIPTIPATKPADQPLPCRGKKRRRVVLQNLRIEARIVS